MKYIVCWTWYDQHCEPVHNWKECESPDDVLDSVSFLSGEYGLKEEDILIFTQDALEQNTVSVADIRKTVAPLAGTVILYGNPGMPEFYPDWFKGLPNTIVETADGVYNWRRSMYAYQEHIPNVMDLFYADIDELGDDGIRKWNALCDYRRAYKNILHTKPYPKADGTSPRTEMLANILTLLTGEEWTHTILRNGVSFQMCLYRQGEWTNDTLGRLEEKYFSIDNDEELAAALSDFFVTDVQTAEDRAAVVESDPHTGDTIATGSGDLISRSALLEAFNKDGDRPGGCESFLYWHISAIETEIECAPAVEAAAPLGKIVVFQYSDNDIQMVVSVENYDDKFQTVAANVAAHYEDTPYSYKETMLDGLRKAGYRLCELPYDTFTSN